VLSRDNLVILAVAVLAAALGGWLQHESRLARVPAGVVVAQVGEPAPALELPDLQGHPHRLADYRGRRVLLNFWASWCGPCLDELPALDKMQAKFGENGPIVLGIAMDESARVRPPAPPPHPLAPVPAGFRAAASRPAQRPLPPRPE